MYRIFYLFFYSCNVSVPRPERHLAVAVRLGELTVRRGGRRTGSDPDATFAPAGHWRTGGSERQQSLVQSCQQPHGVALPCWVGIRSSRPSGYEANVHVSYQETGKQLLKTRTVEFTVVRDIFNCTLQLLVMSAFMAQSCVTTTQ